MRRPTATWLGWAVLGLSLGGCSIEGTRQRGDECLQDRECVSPLRCEVTTDGRSLCVSATRLDAGPPVDLGAPPVDSGPAPVDAGPGPVDAPDVPVVPDVPAVPDVSMSIDVRPVVDVPVAVDVPVDVRVDAGQVMVVDVGVVDASVDASGDVQRADAGDDGAV
jgi:hypothetical protein